MDSPNGSSSAGTADEGVLKSTPFRERALQEQRLREELLLSETPGLKRASTKKYLAANFEDPSEVKEKLRDLSSLLVSQGRNLTSVLAEQASIKDEVTLGSETGDKPSPAGSLPEKTQPSIANAIFSQLEATRHRPKIRKIEPVVIRDIEQPTKEPGQQQSSPPALEVGIPSDREPSPPPQEVGLYDDLPMHNGVALSPRAEPVHNDLLENDDSEQRSSEDSEPEGIEPLTITYLKRLFSSYMSQNDIRFGPGSWRSLQDSSVRIIEKMAEKLSEEHGTLVTSRQNILKMFELYEIVPVDATNEDLYEMCCRYLPLEELNELEMALFL